MNQIDRLKVKVDRVIDGDTFACDAVVMNVLGLELKFPGLHFRLLGVDTPEKKDPGYAAATDFTRKHIEGKEVTLLIHGKDVFGRVLCTVFLTQKKTLNDLLIKAKLAEVYKK